MNRDELVNLIPAYVLGALDEGERVAFERWLAADPAAPVLLSEYQQVADRLAILAPFRPAPDHLQADLRQRLAASSTRPEAPAARPGSARRSVIRARWLLAAAAALIVVVVGSLALRPGGDDSPTPADLFAQLAAQSGANRFALVPGDVSAEVSGELVVSADGRQAILRVAALPALAEDQTFQLWLVDQTDQRTSGGLFRAEQDADATYIRVPLQDAISGYKGFGVSLEPAGGSPFDDKPTGPRVFSVPVS